jgi:hypothetical protein
MWDRGGVSGPFTPNRVARRDDAVLCEAGTNPFFGRPTACGERPMGVAPAWLFSLRVPHASYSARPKA